MISALGDISGAHFNPAVTIGFFTANRLPGEAVLPYIFSQLSGALIGLCTVTPVISRTSTDGCNPTIGNVAPIVDSGSHSNNGTDVRNTECLDRRKRKRNYCGPCHRKYSDIISIVCRSHQWCFNEPSPFSGAGFNDREPQSSLDLSYRPDCRRFSGSRFMCNHPR